MKKNDLAAVIIEPVLGGGGCIPATKEYLLCIQEFCHKNNILFILDEIVTGFRFRFGCLYNTMKLDPDLVTLGKIVGGGFPIGVICGKNEEMKYASTSIFSKTERAYIGGGTFSANPLTMMAGSTMLTIIKNKGNLLYNKLNSFGIETRKMLDKKFGGSVITTGIGSLFLTHFLNDSIYKINNATDAAKCNTKKLHDYHFHMIANDGIFFLPGKLGAYSDAHTKSDINAIAKSTDKFLTKFKKLITVTKLIIMIFFASKEKTEDLLYQAMSFMEKREPKSAISFFKKIIKQDPKNIDALYNQGIALNQLRKYQDAITCFDKVLEINPKHIAAINNRGIALAELGNTDDALEYYNKAIEIDPKYSAAHYNKGVLYDKLLQHEEAIQSLDEAIKCDSGNVNTAFYRGVVLGKMKKHEEALNCFENIYRKHPQHMDAFFH